MREIQIEIKNGEVIIEGEDFGPDCLTLTAKIEEALGIVQLRQLKPHTQEEINCEHSRTTEVTQS